MGLILGFDTSCYTSSVSCIDRSGIVLDVRTVLSVPLGERGLRQSDALFQHNRNLPGLIDTVLSQIDPSAVEAVGVSTKPTCAEDSYMPVFLAGRLAALSIARALRVPLIETNHQAGHIRAACANGNEGLLEKAAFYAMHISGGTTDLLRVNIEANSPGMIEQVGRCTDLHAGQTVDRVAVAMGLPFPGGKHLEKLALEASERAIRIPSSVRGFDCSLSGVEANCIRLLESGKEKESEVAFALYDVLARTFYKLMKNVHEETGCGEFLLCGGVASSMLLRSLIGERNKLGLEIRFGESVLSSDNAVGVAHIAGDRIWNTRT